MQDLIKDLQEKVGLTEEQALQSVETIKEFIKSKLPPMMHDMVENFLKNDNDADDQLGNMMKG